MSKITRFKTYVNILEFQIYSTLCDVPFRAISLINSHNTKLTIMTIYLKVIIRVINSGEGRLRVKMTGNKLETLSDGHEMGEGRGALRCFLQNVQHIQVMSENIMASLIVCRNRRMKSLGPTLKHCN